MQVHNKNNSTTQTKQQCQPCVEKAINIKVYLNLFSGIVDPERSSAMNNQLWGGVKLYKE